MIRWRVAVALMIPEPFATEVDVLRRALGEPRLERLAPHLTLIPPLNLKGMPAMSGALAALRSAAGAQAGPLGLTLGPVTSFEPITPTIHLAVAGMLERLEQLRSASGVGALARTAERPFVPHVTLLAYADAELIRSARVALANYRADPQLDRIVLLVDEPGPAGRTWRALADVRFAGVRVVGRGGLEVELTTSTLLDPEAADALDVDPDAALGGEVVTTARREGRVVGVAWPGAMKVASEATGHGIDDLLQAELAWRLSQ